MNFNPSSFFKQFPELKDIASRLHESELQARHRNEFNEKQASKQVNEFTPPKKPQIVYGDHAVISSYYKDRQWWNTPNVPKEGEKAFVKSLENIINTRNPDAIHVDIYKGKGGRSKGPDFSQDFYLTENVEEIKPLSAPEVPARIELGSVIEQFDKKLENLKISNPETGASAIELMKIGFERELDKIRAESEKKEIIHKYEGELKDLRNIVAQKDSEINELQSELEEMEGELGGVDENKAPAWMDHPLMQQGSRLLSGLMEKFVFQQPDRTALAGGGQAPATPSATLEEEPERYPGLEPAHQEGIENLSDFFARLTLQDFREVFILLASLQHADGSLNREKLQQLTAFLTVKE
jgi:hypothetical protein